MGGEGFEPPKALRQLIYSQPLLSAQEPAPSAGFIIWLARASIKAMAGATSCLFVLFFESIKSLKSYRRDGPHSKEREKYEELVELFERQNKTIFEIAPILHIHPGTV